MQKSPTRCETQLANLETYLELLAGTTDPNTQQTYLQALRESEQKLSFLTENFIKMARLEQKIIQIHKQPPLSV